jgi:hypothetical protein
MSGISVRMGEELFLLHEWREHDPSRSAIRNMLAGRSDFSVWLYIVTQSTMICASFWYSA